MLNIILFDNDARNHLLPLTATRPVCEILVGIVTIREKWERQLNAYASYITQDYLSEKYPFRIEEDNLFIAGNHLPTESLVAAIQKLAVNEALLKDGELIAARLDEMQMEALVNEESIHEIQGTELKADIELLSINRLHEITALNDRAIREDFIKLTRNVKSQPLSHTNRVSGANNVFIEKGAKIEHCILNATTGPIYIGQDVEIMEGSILRGPISIGKDSIVKMGAKIYGPSSFGPACRLGGEISRSVMIGYSNKGHEGYLGDSVLGEWCNLGADTNSSNMKNNYGEVKLWNYEIGRFEKTGTNFCGLFMGDHSKAGINTMFNTGTVVGVMANVYGAGYPRNFIPDFAWGGADGGYRTYIFEQACETAAAVMGRRKKDFTELEKSILYHIYDRTADYRSWEKEKK